MKIIRYLDSNGNENYGAEKNGQNYRLEGDIYANPTITEELSDVVKLLAPISPEIILCIGLNYKFHAEESGFPEPDQPILFIKGRNAIQNPGDPVEIPTHLASHKVDYECELAVVISKTCKNANEDNALDFVLGYTCANDVSARDWQIEWGGGQWCKGKSFDTFAPLGPCLVTADEIEDPNNLTIKTILNGESVQDWNTNDMIFNVKQLITFLSGSTTLFPGTVILTGTPQGVGSARTPQLFMEHGDTVTIEIEKIGSLTNPVINEA
ncbi:MAG: 5-carboxymethyl-2-hydroxymuconate isomerase [Opitutaceae bacterium]|nr:5-carboxymethyl-2-hydroxymuconate isomerase [Opitutaceae bacterium]|tara:strand:+ start:629 stop:1429 length:801 start_codon:yes stop_codon:yes gene_type:complete